jgi:hypothetical protein
VNVRRQTLGKVLAGAWLAVLIVTVALAVWPVCDGLIRLAIAVAVPALWLGAVLLLRKHRKIALVVLLLGVLVGVFLCLPGRRPDVERLRTEYVRSLRAYAGAPYVWGGENRFGIDCSGLVRGALIKANTRLSVTTLNPGLAREALALWWYDCSARALRDEYRGLTALLFKAKSINAIADPELTPGDIAVTADGIHVLAYLGDGVWIEADPGHRKVIEVRTPTRNRWFAKPVHVLRWFQLKEPVNE